MEWVDSVVDWLYTLSAPALVALLVFIWWLTGPRASRYIRTIHNVAQYVMIGGVAIYGFMLWGG